MQDIFLPVLGISFAQQLKGKCWTRNQNINWTYDLIIVFCKESKKLFSGFLVGFTQFCLWTYFLGFQLYLCVLKGNEIQIHTHILNTLLILFAAQGTLVVHSFVLISTFYPWNFLIKYWFLHLFFSGVHFTRKTYVFAFQIFLSLSFLSFNNHLHCPCLCPAYKYIYIYIYEQMCIL